MPGDPTTTQVSHDESRNGSGPESDDTRLLQELGTRRVTGENIQAIYEEILDAAIKLTRADAGLVQIFEPAPEELVLLTAKGFPPEFFERFQRVNRASPTSCGLALSSSQRAFVDFDVADGIDASGTLEQIAAAGFSSAQSTPLIGRSGVLIGMLTTHWRQRHRPAEHELRHLDLLARQAADLIKHREADLERKQHEERLARELHDTTILRNLSCRLIGEERMPVLYDETVAAAMALMGSTMGSIQMLAPEGDCLHLLGWKGFHEEAASFWQRVALESRSTCGTALALGERVFIPDIGNCEMLKGSRDLDYYLLSGIHAVQSTPLVSRTGRLVGMLSTHWDHVHQPEEREFRFFDLLARQAADLIERAQTEKQRAELRQRQEFLLKLGDSLRPLADPVEIQATASRLLGEYLEADRVGYAEAQDNGETIVVRHHFTRGVPGIEGCYRCHDYGPELLETFRAGITVVLPDVANDPALSSRERQAYGTLQIGASLNKPLNKEGRLVAVMFIHYREAHGFGPGEISLIEEVAERTWAAVERACADQARRVSDQRLRVALESARMAAWDWNVELDTVRWNDRHFLILGLKPDGQEKSAGYFTGFIHPDDRPAVEAALLASVAAAGAFSHEFRIIRADNRETRWMRGSGQTVEAADGKAVRMTGVMYDITDLKAQAKELQEARDELELRVAARTRELEAALQRLRDEVASRERIERERRELLERLVWSQEAERSRVSRELHDNLGQHMVAVLLRLDTFQRQLSQSGDTADYGFTELRAVVDELIKATHRQSWELRPAELDELGLAIAMENFVQLWSEKTGIAAYFHASGSGIELQPEQTIAFYRVAQEALTNVARHAQATRVSVHLVMDREPALCIEDDGCGFDPAIASQRLGLLGMKERLDIVGGSFLLESAPGRGTVIKASIP